MTVGRRQHWVGIGSRNLIAFASAVLLGLYLASGIYVVDADQRGVVRRFGAVVGRTGPGMHYHLPWPAERVDVLQTTTVVKTGVGFALAESKAQSGAGMAVLTGDTNILQIGVVLQYIIRDPADFLVRIDQPAALVGLIAQGVLTATVIGMPVDDVLTTGRVAIQNNIAHRTQEILDKYQSGIQITSVNIMNVTLDRSVAQAFQDVANAMADREKTRNEAMAYRNDLIPKARGEARGAVGDAKNYREQRIAEAVGETGRFLSLAREYERAPEVTRTRLYLEAMERIFRKVKTYIVDTQSGRVPLNLRVTSP
ncbi:MAG: FtsH protease activity modulator HflK [Acetobacteraceae bacterium]|nr:FtsH protease activity modulator HflK [Acetobacteraceae bacterium]